MSGKTSFIRTVGINVLLGQPIHTCFAARVCMPPIRLFSAIRINDDLMNDKSYYFEEVLTIQAIIDKSREPVANLFLLDKIFKGTNSVERISAGKAVLSFVFICDPCVSFGSLIQPHTPLNTNNHQINTNKNWLIFYWCSFFLFVFICDPRVFFFLTLC